MLHRTTAGLLLVKITDFGISKDTSMFSLSSTHPLSCFLTS